MADVHDKRTRSYNMSRIKSKNTKPELLVRRYLHAHGFRYKLHDKLLPGKPDLVFPKYKTVVFIHGCFWHGHHNCKDYIVPKTNTEWWLKKIERNKSNHEKAELKLKELGWQVLVIWECDLKTELLDGVLAKLSAKIVSYSMSYKI